MHRVLALAFITIAVCIGCGGGGSQSALPTTDTTAGANTRLAPQSVSTGPALVQINAGGPAVAGFAADEYFAGYSGTGSDTAPIDVSGANSAPAAVYGTYRTAPKTLTYTITGLAPLGAYTGELYFEEPLLGGTGRRVMNVTVGGATMATGLDIFAKTGATHKAYALAITGTATSSGTLDIVLTATVNDAILSGLMLQAVYSTDTETDININSGGPATAGFSADRGFSGYSGTNADNNPIDVSGPNVAPAAIYASYRTAPKQITYSFANLAADATYSGYVYFEEPLLAGVGRRLLTISTDWGLIAQDFDIYKAAGNKTHTAVALPISSLADGTGAIDIFINSTVNDAIISGISLHVSATAPPTPTRPDD